MKTILGLDLGTNSIGWALIQQDFENKKGEILGMGSRIIPMSQDIMGEFGKGNSVSQTAERTGYRGVRRIRERYLLRRERLHRVLNVLGYLPKHFAAQIDFEKRLGQFFTETEPKLAYQAFTNENSLKENKTEYDFIFKKSFEEMLADFKAHQPELLNRKNNKGEDAKLPYDWTIYYLRKKALSQKIEKEELAWILLNFNQKRGYFQLRGEDEETSEKREYVLSLKVVEIVKGEVDKKNIKRNWYSFTLENNWNYSATFTSEPQWLNTEKEFLITEELDENGVIKIVKDKKSDISGKEKRKITPLPTFEEIDLMTKKDQDKIYKKIKAKTEITITNTGKTVGTYIYDTLLQKPNQKINGKLVRTIERKFYKDELKQILIKQLEFHKELQSEDMYGDAIRELYLNNEAHQLTLDKKDFAHLFLEDIIFYQRPLKSKKSSISNCSLEYRTFKAKDKDGNEAERTEYLKAIPKSHPLYQEFRIWQWMYNLNIFKQEDDKSPVTSEFLRTVEDYENLFEFLNDRKEVDQKALLKHFKLSEKTHRWNFVEDKKYPCNETKIQISTRLDKTENVFVGFLTTEIEQKLWHIIYSVTDKMEYEKALKTFAEKHKLDVNSFVENFKKFPPFKSDYGSFSEKAIKKLLPLMRMGKYWSWDTIDEKIKLRIDKIITTVDDEYIKDRTREISKQLTDESHFQGLQLWLAQYVVYDRHSEAALVDKWDTIADLEQYLEDFKQHSLRNPIVEQVVTETLRVVKDIWSKYGNGTKDFFSEIHIELGGEMKNTAEDRKRITEQVTSNENTNLRIKALLAELVNDKKVENVRPYSPTQQEILKIYEDGVLNSGIEIDDDILKISKTAQPSSADLQRYKLWLEQKYRSPYTGQTIPLNKLFTTEYEIEHIIPQSRYFDDSFGNKVICEAAVNKLKDNQMGLEFIKNHHGQIVETGFGKTIKVFEEREYEEFVKDNYTKNRGKRNKLMMEEIPEKMIERQLNDTRYISKYISSVLSNIVREAAKDDGINSKNILPSNGKITSTLKQDWGLNDVWNELVLPRFERMNAITNSTDFTAYNEKYQKYLPTIPIELSRGFQKKRIDHRHHAMDALVIACATRSHVNLLNNQHAKSDERFDLNRKLRRFEKVSYFDVNKKRQIEKEVPKDFLKPWNNFTVDAKKELEKIVISFKQNLRVINKTTNKYESYKDENGRVRIGKDGKPKKEFIAQTKGDSWAIRKPMHQETVAGLIKLRKQKTVTLNAAIDEVENIVEKSLRKQIQKLVNKGLDKKQIAKFFKELDNKWEEKDISKTLIYYWETDENGTGINASSRVLLNDTFNEKKIESIADTAIQQILVNHLTNYKGKLDEKGKEIPAALLAFSPEGVEEMNKNIIALNKGKFHQPILKVRTYEPKGNKFSVGQTGNKKDKFVIAAIGTNLFFAVYEDEKGKRKYETIPFNEVIEHQKWRATLSRDEQKATPMFPVKAENGKFLFSLSPNDLVYMPTEEENANLNIINFNNLDKEQTENIYKVVSFTGNRLYAIPNKVATSIVDKTEFSLLNKVEFNLDKKSIKEHCIKINLDRLGNISKA